MTVLPRPSIGLLAFMAWRGLGQSRLAAALMVIAIAAGVAFQIPNTANLAGYEREIVRQGVTNGTGDVRVRPADGRELHAVSTLVAALEQRPGVRAAIPIYTLAGAVGRGGTFEDAFVLGVAGDAAQRPYHLLRGVHLAAGDDAGVLVGSAIAGRLGIDVGDDVEVRVILVLGNDVAGEDALGRYTMRVRGIAAGSFSAPSSIILDRGFLAKELGVVDTASAVLVHARDHRAADALAAGIVRDVPGVTAVAWDRDNPFLRAAVRSSATVGTVSAAMVALAVVIPVWALLYINVLHRQRQVGLMGAIGLGRGAIFVAFLLQALVVGLIGITLGALGGHALVTYFDAHPIFAMEGFVIRPLRSPDTYARPAGLILAATLLAGAWPAHRASRLDPARVLRSQR